MAYDLTHKPSDRRCVTAVFDTQAAAETAKTDLLAAGFAPTDVTLSNAASVTAAPETAQHESVFQALLDIFVFMPSHDRMTFEEALRRGGVAVAVRTDPDLYEQAIEILDRDGAIELQDRDMAPAGAGEATNADAPTGPTRDPDTASFEATHHQDPLVNPGANADVRERIGTGTSDMTAGTDLAPASAASPGLRDTSHGRRRIRSYLSAPAGIDPGI